jgi:hypothetical protein
MRNLLRAAGASFAEKEQPIRKILLTIHTDPTVIGGLSQFF